MRLKGRTMYYFDLPEKMPSLWRPKPPWRQRLIWSLQETPGWQPYLYKNRLKAW